MKEVIKLLKEISQEYQYPDKVEITKQRGFWVKLTWKGLRSDLVVQYDVNSDLIRGIGDTPKIPKHVAGEHIYWDK